MRLGATSAARHGIHGGSSIDTRIRLNGELDVEVEVHGPPEEASGRERWVERTLCAVPPVWRIVGGERCRGAREWRAPVLEQLVVVPVACRQRSVAPPKLDHGGRDESAPAHAAG